MQLESCYFEDGTGEWTRLARVLAFTAQQHCAAWTRSIVAAAPERRRVGTGIVTHIANTQKLDLWCQRVQAAADGTELLLLDADLCLLRSLDEIWQQPFDLAYATKQHMFPFNLGVLFVRVSPTTRRFFEMWRQENDQLFRPGEGARLWRQRYGGINQAAFGALLERGALDFLQRRALECTEWNCEESAWAAFDPDRTRILHIKGTLRRSVFLRQTPDPAHVPLIKLWRSLDREASRHVAA